MCFNFALLLGGMPSVTLSDLAVPRLEVISFFLMGLLISALVVKLVWNALCKDFVWLPRLSYGKACGVVVLWGLLFVVVLTMISGARELMTPGAWEKHGATYKLAKEDKPGPDNREMAKWWERRSQIEDLKLHLNHHAQQHDGVFPQTLDELDVPRETREVPGISGTRYILVPGCSRNGPPRVLAYEPEVYEGKHFVVFTSGPPRELAYDEIQQLLEPAP